MTDALEAALHGTIVRSRRHFRELTSTNDHAISIAAGLSSNDVPCLVFADVQTAGRGRGGNRWWSGRGALTFSLIIEPGRWGVPHAMWPRLSVAAGGAVAEAISSFARACPVQLKWPNDVYLCGRKVCGILVETVPDHADRLVVGIGVNVDNSFAGAPPDIVARAVSMADAVGAAPPREEVLGAIVRQLDVDLQRLAAMDDELLKSWRRRCFLTGRVVSIADVDGSVTGACLGIEDDASLLIQTEAGPQRRYAGVVSVVE
jgi:BirA family transcriptional regulator, biotin operon repressor / biotin---[acetyl-CoA-carboxylase] ligase